MKLFRFHRGGFKESIDTTIEIKNFSDIEKILKEKYNAKNIKLDYTCIHDERLPNEWNGIEFRVIGDYKYCTGCCFGYCNFIDYSAPKTSSWI